MPDPRLEGEAAAGVDLKSMRPLPEGDEAYGTPPFIRAIGLRSDLT